MLKHKLLGATAAAEPVFIEDVFSTYLYTGNGFGQTITNGINLGTQYAGPSLEFDGVNDFLSRSSDLSGNVDGKQVTFSAWISPQKTGSWTIYSNDTFKFTVYGNESQIIFVGRNASGTNVVSAENTRPPFDTIFSGGNWHHILISFDLSNAANRYVYINDVAVSMDWNTYTNSDIDFTNSTHYIGDRVSGGYRLKSYLSNVFLDYTYRDMSLEANRRLFITGNLTPASGQENLSPILYLPMTTSAGANAGTGGDFTINGNPQIEDQFGPFTSPSGEGGLVWIKSRSAATNHFLFDTERGTTDEINSNTTDAEASLANSLTAFNADGFSIGSAAGIGVNAATYASWTFRKAERFFDVVTYTGTGANRTVAHDLGVVPGCIIVKRTDTTGDWQVYHRSNTAAPETDYLVLNSTAATVDDNTRWNDTLPTSTVFSLGTNATVNASGGTYVAYLFAHDPLGPSGDGSDGLIACGSFADNGSGTFSVNLGWEPQFVILKPSNATDNWYMLDSMRNMTHSGSAFYNDSHLVANSSAAEATAADVIDPTPTGFISKGALGAVNIIYIAIRRGPMREPTSGTEVFAVDSAAGTAPSPPWYYSGWPVDMAIAKNGINSTAPFYVADRLRGNIQLLQTASTAAEGAFGGSGYAFDQMLGMGDSNLVLSTYYSWMFRRAPGFFDVVAYTGTGSARTVSHNLGVVPEMVIIKKRNNVGDKEWIVYAAPLGNATRLEIQSTSGGAATGMFNSTTPTETVFSVAGDSAVNGSGDSFIAYLFATLAGVSKVGSYTGNGSNQTINCGFTGGARFVLIKRTSATGDWYVWDTARGIVAGNDPHLSLNSTAAEVTTNDSIDPDSSGFIVNQLAATNINVSSASYIYLAIA